MSTPLDQFVSLSSALTGVNPAQLRPAVDPIGIAGQYLAKIQNVANFDNLLATFTAKRGELGGDQAAAFVLADPALGPVARSIIKMWLLGTWYDPQNAQPPQVVSTQAYKESLVWKVMQSHPMGYSMWDFGYWAGPPPAFDQFIQVNNGSSSNGSN
jgi:Membrane bound FAD containing D-sorbitol dehydrogenase